MAKTTGNYDLLLRNGKVIDGTGNPWFRADVGVRGGRIAQIGDLGAASASETIDADGLVVSPGFIDIHNHTDLALLVKPEAEHHVMQGVTTVGVGSCGQSPAPFMAGESSLDRNPHPDRHLLESLPNVIDELCTFDRYLGLVERQGCAVNVAALVGHGAIRVAALNWERRLADGGELDQMRRLAAECMEGGAQGMSSGLAYFPGVFSDTIELIELMKVVARYGGIYVTHIRDESSPDMFRASVQEAIHICRASGAPAHISHLETHYPNWGMQQQVLTMVEDARLEGLDVTCDVPPYVLGQSTLTSTMPEWALEGGVPGVLERIKNPEVRRRISEDRCSQRNIAGQMLLDGLWDKIWIEESVRDPRLTGKNLAEIAAIESRAPSWDTVFDLLLLEGREILITGQWHNEDDIRILVQHPLSLIISDSTVLPESESRTHPRGFGTFPMVIRKYVRGETRQDEPREPGKRLLSLHEAVRKMTSFPAQRLRLCERGVIREGYWADMVVFDPEAIEDQATYANPRRYPKGIEYVFVNGQLVVKRGRHLGRLPGHALRSRRALRGTSVPK